MTLLQALAIHATRGNDGMWVLHNRALWIETKRLIEVAAEAAEIEFAAARITVEPPEKST